jgi:hypothetical protein
MVNVRPEAQQTTVRNYAGWHTRVYQLQASVSFTRPLPPCPMGGTRLRLPLLFDDPVRTDRKVNDCVNPKVKVVWHKRSVTQT